MRKLLLNCDQVFDVLTRGPFPSGDETDQPVESHLRACHECRQLAEALQPAVYLLHESLSAQDCEELPRYQGVLSAIDKEREVWGDFRADPPSRGVASRSIAGPSAPRAACAATPRAAQQLEAGLILRTLASVLLLVTVGVASWSLVTTLGVTQFSPLAAAGGDAAGPRPAATGQQPEGLVRLASLNLPTACFPSDWPAGLARAGQPLPTTDELKREGVRCCTECHHAASDAAQQGHAGTSDEAPRGTDVRLVAVVQENCAACHTQPVRAL